ncbi:unnamed protein product, partial [marine sediment metagenome]
LLSSKEIEQKYGEAPVFINFDYGEGKVYHMISHFYLQRSETRTKRQEFSGAEYLDEKAVPLALKSKYAKMGIAEMKLGDVESAFTSSAMMSKIMFDKKKQIKSKKNAKQKK